MERRIQERLHDGILDTVKARFGIADDGLHELGGFESFIYGYHQNGDDFILRLGHSLRRTPDQIHGEVDWINHLARGGASVSCAVPSVNGRLVETIEDGQGGAFLATAFEKAAGSPVWTKGGWREDWVENYGRLLGRIHALSKTYQPAQPHWRRFAWDEPPNVTIPDVDPLITACHEETVAYLRQLPTDAHSYGMIHQDAHSANLFVDDNGRITLFDFDDCCFGHFANDIAMVLFYALINQLDVAAYGRFFWPAFWRGYCQENTLDVAWLEALPHFMKLREVDLFAYITRDIPTYEPESWVGQFMYGRYQRIADQIPTFNLDFAALVGAQG